jgi:hypothetical protein
MLYQFCQNSFIRISRQILSNNQISVNDFNYLIFDLGQYNPMYGSGFLGTS